MSGIIARMSRRPGKIIEKLSELKTVKIINELKNGELRVLVRVMHETLTGPRRSIAFGNLKKAVRRNDRVVVLGGADIFNSRPGRNEKAIEPMCKILGEVMGGEAWEAICREADDCDKRV